MRSDKAVGVLLAQLDRYFFTDTVNHAMKYMVWGLVILLVVLHQDLWNWGDDRLVLGFMPATLAYHAALSIAASIVWFLATKFAWPLGLEDDLEVATPVAESKGAES